MRKDKLVMIGGAGLLVVIVMFAFQKGPNPDDGRIVVGIKDAAASIDTVRSILITVNKV